MLFFQEFIMSVSILDALSLLLFQSYKNILLTDSHFQPLSAYNTARIVIVPRRQ
jgi:hypothetical protein